jgi:hypothetical protein
MAMGEGLAAWNPVPGMDSLLSARGKKDRG